MSTQIQSFDLTPILIQSGYGIPNHISSLGSEYTDLNTAIKYTNKNGLSLWVQMLDSTYSISGGSGSVFTGGTVTGPTYFLNGLTSNTISSTTYYGDGSNLTGIGSSSFTGGTVSGPTNFITGLTANTISATTYYNLPTDIRVTGGTYTSGTTTFRNNAGGTFTVTGYSTGYTLTYNAITNTLGYVPLSAYTDTKVTGGTYSNGSTSFTNNTGGTFSVTGFTTPFTGGTLSGGITANTISATTYYNLPTDVRVTGGTYSNGTAIFTNNTGGTFTVTGFSTSNGTTFTGGTVTGGTNFTNGVTANTLSATSVITAIGGFSGSSVTTSTLNTPLVQNTSNYQMYLSSYTGIIGWYNNGFDVQFLPSGQFRIPSVIMGGTYDGNQINLSSVATISGLRNNTVSVETGTGGTADNTFNFIGNTFYSPVISATTYLNLPYTGPLWYAENTTPPSTSPIASGASSIAIGNNAEASSNDMIVIGTAAGVGVTGQKNNFIGYYAGNGATNAYNANFIGVNAGYLATGANKSTFIGHRVGEGATYAYHSVFLGRYAGYYSTNANNSNFFGDQTGQFATNANNSNFFGFQAGASSVSAHHSNFLGVQAGTSATDANDSNFMGSQAGQGATYASFSNFMGNTAGYGATDAYFSNFLGYQAGSGAISASESNFIGYGAGLAASSANASNFFGTAAGQSATNANGSNFIGYNAGNGATTASGSNFMGTTAGYAAINAQNSNFFGTGAGYGATSAYESNFFGVYAGQGATSAYLSNFFGSFAGNGAVYAINSNFMGLDAGNGATSAYESNFFGARAGQAAIQAHDSNFIGVYAGYQATGASYSNIFGWQAGYASNSTLSVGSNNIIIGTNITLPVGTSNAINIGGVLFGTGTYSAITGNPIISAQTQGRIGINVVNPIQALHVSGNTLVQGGFTANTISATTYQGLPLDIYVTGGTFVSSAGTTTFTNNTGGTFTVTGQAKNLILYAEYTGATTFGSPTATGVRSVAIGDGANAISTDAISIGTGTNKASGVNNTSVIAIGAYAGYNSRNSTLSNFIGSNAGLGNNYSNNSNFFGANAGNSNNYSGGSYTINAAYSIYLGNNVGRVNTTDFSGSNNVVIGNTVGVASGTTNTLNIGGVIWANGLYSNTTGYTSTIAQTIGKVGVNINNPSEALHINGNIRSENGIYSVSAYTGSYTDGIVTDYVTGNGRISVGTADGISFYNNGVGSNLLLNLSSGGTLSGLSYTSKSTYGTVNINPSNQGMIVFSGSNTIGGSGYTDFIKVTNTAAGATNINKTIRLNNTGGLEIINSAYNSALLTLTDSGNLSVAGTINANAWSPGQVIKDTMLSNTDITVNATTIATSTSDTDFITYSYTPVSSTSYLIIHYHLGNYDATSGTGNDAWISRIKVDGGEITYSVQSTVNGFRTGVLFPLTGRYTNTSTAAKSIVVACRRTGADDSVIITNSTTSMWLRITEVAR